MERVHSLRIALKLRLKRQRLILRAFRKRRELTSERDQTAAIKANDIIAAIILRNEIDRLPHFLAYYRALGVGHFLVVDNGSTDGSSEFLSKQADVSVWSTSASYKKSRFGMDWITWLLWKYGHDRWVLTLDADELLVLPHDDTRELNDLIQHLECNQMRSFGALMVDLYPKGPVHATDFKSGDNPLGVLDWFDGDNIRFQKQMPMENYWVQGGVRERVFFAADPRRSPTLNKIPLVKWNRRFVYVNSTHSMLPKKLNRVYPHAGKKPPCGALLHTKFLPMIGQKSREEKQRKQHFANSELYDNYYDRLSAGPDLWVETSMRYEGWEQLESLGIMSRGNWL